MARKVDLDRFRRHPHLRLMYIGMVACSQPLAAEVGLEILRKGGNAGKPISLARSRHHRRTVTTLQS